jgi:hypothetical protein
MKIYKIANLYSRGNYGAWIAPSGKLYPVVGYQEHDLALDKIFQEEGLPVNWNIRAGKGSSADGLKLGFIRIVNFPTSIHYIKPLNNIQKSVLMDYIIECPEDDIWINAFGVTNSFMKRRDIDEIEKFITRDYSDDDY